MNRRDTLGAVLALGALPLAALAQQVKHVRRIGYFSLSSLQSNAGWLAAFREGMAALRWVEGRDYVIEARFTEGVAQAGPDLAAELVATRPDLLLAIADQGVRELAKRTKTIPIVFAIAQDPVGSGVAASLQRPGGNATGLASLARDLSAKRLQLIKEAFPRVERVVLLFEPGNVGSTSEAREIEKVGPRLKVQVTPIELRRPADIEPAFAQGVALGAQAYVVTQSGVINSQRQEIVGHTVRLRVPSIFSDGQFVEAGGLMSYSPSYADNFRRAAGYVDKILKGANPGDLPVEQPNKFELILNMKTAKAIGARFPQSFLARADRVIE